MHALLVGPDAALSARIEALLTRLGHTVSVEPDAARAHDTMLLRPPGLVLVDWDALGAAALDLTEPLRSSPGRPAIAAITRHPLERAHDLIASRLRFLDPADDDQLLELRLVMLVTYTARREDEDVRFLAEASHVLSETLEWNATLHNLARLAVVSLADFCVIDVLSDDGVPRRVEAVHRDPAMQPLMEALRRHQLNPNGPLGEVLRTGRERVSNATPPGSVAIYARDPAHLGVLGELAPASAIVAPLTAHGRMEGVITFGSHQPGRYGEADRTLALELAARGAFALANARLHRKLVQSEAQLRAIADAAFEAVVVHENARVLLVNQATAQMFGYDAGEMIGTDIWRYLAPESRDYVRSRIAAHASTPHTAMGLRRDGSVFPIEVQVRETTFEGRAVRAAAIRDITERQKLQAQLMLADRLSAMGTLAAGVAHEINNPLSFVSLNIGYADTRLGESTDPEVRRALAEAAAGAERVRRIVRDLRTLSRVDDDARCAVDVREIVAASLGIASNELRHRARVSTAFEDVPKVVASEWRLGQVFLNLLVNAAQAIPEGAVEKNDVHVTTALRDGHVVVSVSDTGCGIPDDVRGRIFDPFFTTKPSGVGTGLGLSICQNIVLSLGGHIEVESQAGKGSTFRVVLPPAPLNTPIAVPVLRDPPPPRRARVLIVDDEPLLRSSMLRLLAPAHDAQAVASAQEALELVRNGTSFDVVLCDVMMPGMTGADLYKALSESHPALAGRTIFMTGGAFSGSAAEFLAGVKNAKVEKPFEPAALMDLISRVASA